LGTAQDRVSRRLTHSIVSREGRRRLAAGYFLVQASAVAAWWTLLAVSPAARPYFALREAPIAALGAFAPGDLGLVVLASLVVGIRRGRGSSGPLAWIVAGAMSYGAAYTISSAALGISSALGAILMVPAAVASLLAASELTRHVQAEPVPPGAAA
jgi:hypothetical protein